MAQKNIKETIMQYYFNNPTAKHRVRELERQLKLPLPSVIRYCRELEKEGILTVLRTGNVVFYTADRISEKYRLEKKLHNIRQLWESGLIEYLKQELSNPPIILFGSYAKGEDIEDSDIDLYIETPSKREFTLNKFEKFLHRKIQIFRSKNLQNLSNPNLANNIVNGIIMNSYVEVFK